jgi:glycosyltransferase involved in cell wall biosynthesis
MSNEAIPLGQLWKIYRSEGMQALQNRSRDRTDELKRIRELTPLTVRNGRIEIATNLPLALNVAAIPPAWEQTEAQIQFLARLEEERKIRTVAWAYPRDNAWWLEIMTAQTAGVFPLGESTNLVDAIQKAAGLARTTVVHIEDLHGLPIHLVRSLADRDHEVILSVFDFRLFCARPHLIEKSTRRFCGYSTDMDRCTRCLKDVDMDVQRNQVDYRRVGADAIRNARVLVYPSAFMQRKFQELHPRRQAGQHEVVIAPAFTRPTEAPSPPSDSPNIAFVGRIHHHGGAAVIPQTMELVLNRNPKANAFVYGTGDSELMDYIRGTKRTKIRGYYRHGTLASMLARDKISVAVVPAIWASSYSIVVDECLAAGIPVIAFDLGAVDDRLNFWDVGRLVPYKHGHAGLATAVFESLARNLDVPKGVIKTIPSPIKAARRHRDLYKNLRVRLSR